MRRRVRLSRGERSWVVVSWSPPPREGSAVGAERIPGPLSLALGARPVSVSSFNLPPAQTGQSEKLRVPFPPREEITQAGLGWGALSSCIRRGLQGQIHL